MPRKPRAAEPVEPAEPIPHTHNNPPEAILEPDLALTPEHWSQRMAQVFAVVRATIDGLREQDARFKANFPLTPAGIVGNAPIGIEKWDDSIQGRAGDLRDRFRAVLKQIDALHAIEKAPVLAAGRAIDGARNALIQLVATYDTKGRLIPGADAPLNRIADRTTLYALYRESESRRAAAEEAERKRLEAEALAAEAEKTMEPEALDRSADAYGQAAAAQQFASAPAADHSRVVGDLGSTTSLRGTWRLFPEKSDLMALVQAVAAGKADIKYLAFNEVRIGVAIRSEQVRDIPGCVIERDLRT